MTILNSTGSSVSAGTYEKAVWEIANRLLLAQRDATKNPLNVSLVQISADLTSSQASISFNIPLTVTKTSTARSYQAKNEITVTPWLTGGDIQGGNATQDLFNLLCDLGELEKDPQKNTTNENRITYTISDDPLVFTGNLTLACEGTVVGSSISLTASNYLA